MRISVRGAQGEWATCVGLNLSSVPFMENTDPRCAALDRDKDVRVDLDGETFTIDVKAVPGVGFRDDAFANALDEAYCGVRGFKGKPSTLFVPGHQTTHLADIYVHIQYSKKEDSSEKDPNNVCFTFMGACASSDLVDATRGKLQGKEPGPKGLTSIGNAMMNLLEWRRKLKVLRV